MLPAHSEFIVHVGDAAIAVWRKQRGVRAWEILDATAIDRSADGRSGFRYLEGALRQSLDRIEQQAGAARCTVVLGPHQAPGLIVQLGDKAVSHALRLKLARHRIGEVLSPLSNGSLVLLDRFRTVGPALVFALDSKILETIRAAFASSMLRLDRIEPAIVWAGEAVGQTLQDGWLGIDDGDGVTLMRVEQRISTFLENRAGASLETFEDCARLVRRTLFRLGEQDQNTRIVLFSFSGRLTGKRVVDGIAIEVSAPFEGPPLVPVVSEVNLNVAAVA